MKPFRPSALSDPTTTSSDGEHVNAEDSSRADAEEEDEAKFVAWLQSELEASPAAAAYPELMSMEGCGAAVLRWRRRYRGNARLWKRLFKRDRVLKEIEETAPIVDRALRWVSSRPEGSPPVTVVDLCSGKGYLGMLLSEMLSPEKVERIVLVDKAWPTCGADEVLPHHIQLGPHLRHDPPERILPHVAHPDRHVQSR